MLRFRYFLFALAILAIAAPLSLALTVEEFVGEDSPLFVRVKGLYGDACLYQQEGSRFLLYDAGLKADDQRGHWYLEVIPDAPGYWIRNRVTGDALNIEGREGFVEVSSMEPTFLSFRWNLVLEGSFCRIHNLWQKTAYISLENSGTDKVQYDPLSQAWLSMKFILIPVEEDDGSTPEEP
ncbi:MAG: hypothetical protein KJ626_14410 [Verrucomicrobia bacterium]|nr:hypothetical protein [Verrucomicrobiota bacterium]